MIDIQRQQQIVFDGLALEYRRLLEFPADPEFGDPGFIEPGQVGDAIEQHLALIRLGLAGDDVHHRGLAGAIRADDGAHFAGSQRQRQIVDGMKAIEGDVHAVEIEQRGSGTAVHDVHCAYSAISGSLTPSSRAALAALAVMRCAFHGSHQLLKVPTIPRGSSSVTRINSAPSMNSQ